MGKKKKEVRERDKGKWPLREASNAALWFFFLDCGGVLWLVSEHHVGRGGTGKYREEGLKMGRQLGGPILFGHFCFQNTENMTETLFFFSLFIFLTFWIVEKFCFFFYYYCLSGRRHPFFLTLFTFRYKKKKTFFSYKTAENILSDIQILAWIKQYLIFKKIIKLELVIIQMQFFHLENWKTSFFYFFQLCALKRIF